MKDISSLAIEVAKIYLQFHKKYTDKLFSLSNVKNSKWWPYFVKCAAFFGNKPDWDTYKFIEAQFEIKDGDIYPYELIKHEAWENFIEYKSRDKNYDKYIAMNLVSSYNLIKKWSKDKGYVETNYKEYFKDIKNQNLIRRKNLSFYLFSILRSFYEFFYNKLSEQEQDSIIEIDELMKLRAAIYTNEKIKNKMKEILNHEFC